MVLANWKMHHTQVVIHIISRYAKNSSTCFNMS